MSCIPGSHHSEETKAKISLAHMGKIPTEEARANMSKAQLGRFVTPEARAKLSKAMMGRRGYWLGRHRTEETKNKLRIARTGTTLTEEHKAKISRSLLGNKRALGLCHTRETRRIISQAHIGMQFTEEHKAKIRQRLMGNQYSLGCQRTDETRAEMSRVQKLRWQQDPEGRAKLSRDAELRWQDPEYKDKILKASMLGRFIHPNKPESLLLELLESTYPSEWKFVGDGQLIIAGRNPDFANVNGRKQLIEMWGDYWHRGEDPQDRIDLFKHYGFSTLVIWEEELKYPDRVLEKIAGFIRTPLRAE